MTGAPAGSLPLRLLLARVRADVGPHRRWFFWAMGAASGAALVGLALPVLARGLVEEVFPSGDAGRLIHTLLLFFLVAAVSLGLSAMRRYLMEKLCHTIISDTRRRIFGHLMTLPPRQIQEAEGGQIVVGFTNDIMALRDSLRALLATAIPLGFMAAVFLGAMLWQSWLLTVALVWVIAPVLVASHAFGRRIHRASHRMQHSFQDLMSDVTELLAGFKDVRLFRLEERLRETYARHDAINFAAKLHLERVMALQPLVIALSVALGVGMIALLSLALLNRGLIEPGELTGFAVCLGLAYPPIQGLGNALGLTFQLSAAYQRIDMLLGMQPETDTPLAAPRVQGAAGPGLEFRGVSFGYGQDEVLSDLSFCVERGETVAVLGASGAGKSTLLELIPRFLQPTRGIVLIDGQDIAGMPLADLRGRIGMVTQQPYLFRGTLMENLRAGAPGATPDAVRRAARMARVEDFADALPQGFASVIESGGTNLSVGQRQRIAIARVLLKNPALLLLDEPTSALDAATESSLSEALAVAAADRTTLTVTHRLGLLRLAQRVIVLDQGRMAEIGTPAELAAAGGAFAALVRHNAPLAGFASTPG